MRGLYNTCLVTLCKTETINDPTEQDEKNVHTFVYYMATYQSTVVIFHASDMILRAGIDS